MTKQIGVFFHYKDKLGIPTKFVKMTKVFFQVLNANIVVNGKASKALVIERGMRQGCPHAPYLLLIMGEAFNVKIYEEQRLGRIKGIRLPISNKRQIIAQYANDINFILKAYRKGMI
jgi:hypothetical protein